MSASNPDTVRLDRTVRRLHWSVLLALAVCALIGFLQRGEPDVTPPPPSYTLTAVGLATATIVSRHLATSTRLAAGVRATLSLVTLGLATAIGVLGVHLAMAGGSRQSGLLFIAAAGLFCVRPPPPATRPERRS